MTIPQRNAVRQVAASKGWDARTPRELGLLLWALFRYYAERLTEADR